MRKLRLDPDSLRVEAFTAGIAAAGPGTIRANSEVVSRHVCTDDTMCTQRSTACGGWCQQPSVDTVQPCGGGTLYTDPGNPVCA